MPHHLHQGKHAPNILLPGCTFLLPARTFFDRTTWQREEQDEHGTRHMTAQQHLTDPAAPVALRLHRIRSRSIRCHLHTVAYCTGGTALDA